MNDGASTKVQTDSPVPSFPGPVSPDGSDVPSGVRLWLRTPSLPRAHAKVGTDHGHRSGSFDHSSGATSCRTQPLFLGHVPSTLSEDEVDAPTASVVFYPRLSKVGEKLLLIQSGL